MTGELDASKAAPINAGGGRNTRYRRAFQGSPAGMLIAATDGRIFDANAALCQMLGRTREQVLAMDVESLFTEQDRPRHSSAAMSLLAGKRDSVLMSAEMVCKDGRKVFVSAHAVVLSRYGQRPTELLYQVQDLSGMRDHLRELTRLAEHDHLTGLLNRRSFEDRLAVAQNMAEVDGIDSPLLIFDLDAFKSVNDNYGHPIGDRLLQEVAKTLRAQFRASDAIARIGGDEFAIVMFGCPAQQAVIVGQKSIDAIAAIDFTEAEAPIRVSVGVAMITGVSTLSAAAFAAADDAMYRAKSRGGNCLAADFPISAATRFHDSPPVCVQPPEPQSYDEISDLPVISVG